MSWLAETPSLQRRPPARTAWRALRTSSRACTPSGKRAPRKGISSVPGEQSVTVTAGGTAHASFANAEITGKIRIVKRDSLTREALAGAEFTVTRLSAPAGATGVGGSVVIVTDASGVAETGWLPWGRYRIEETKVPQHFVDVGFETEVEIRDSGRTCEIEVENEPTKGYIRITKTDRLNGNPIEGVRFDIYENDEYGSALVGSMVTDENGVAVSEPLRKGRYIVREHGETAGYVFEEIALDAVVKPDETTDLSVTNQPVRVRLKLYKRDADEYAGKPADAPGTRGDGELTGAVFRVLAAQDITDRQDNVIYEKGAVVVDSLTTAGQDASVTTDALWPGMYEIVELAPPGGVSGKRWILLRLIPATLPGSLWKPSLPMRVLSPMKSAMARRPLSNCSEA